MKQGSEVFLNCPFDSAYRPRFLALVFALLNCGSSPRSALEVDDAARSRLDRLTTIIQGCALSVHDLCRVDEPRFNMPFEIGLAIGLRVQTKAEQRTLILITSRTKFDRACSDLRGSDPRLYRGAKGLVVEVTRWLQQFFEQGAMVPNATAASRRFQRFWRVLPHAAAQHDLDFLDLTWPEMLFVVHTWLKHNPPVGDSR